MCLIHRGKPALLQEAIRPEVLHDMWTGLHGAGCNCASADLWPLELGPHFLPNLVAKDARAPRAKVLSQN